jgi:ubiquinone/menaquinone biosynthesis C-methylase UbiE
MNDTNPTDIVREGYDAIARIYHEQRDKFKNDDLLALFASHLKPGDQVLDVGCGAGVPVARGLVDTGLNVTGVDVSLFMLELARLHVPEAGFIKMDMRELAFAPESFDGVCAFYSLFHVPREEHASILNVFFRLLRQHGVLLFSTGRCAWEAVADFHGTQMFWSHPDRQVTRQLVVDTGFDVMMSEVQELGGEKHYWIMAKKAHSRSLPGTP